MNCLVSDKPHVPVPPYHGTLWPQALNLVLSRDPLMGAIEGQLRAKLGTPAEVTVS